jgi:hypothetical protein
VTDGTQFLAGLAGVGGGAVTQSSQHNLIIEGWILLDGFQKGLINRVLKRNETMKQEEQASKLP